MPRTYKAANRRLINRTSSGSFRKTTLADIGAGCCDQCGAFFAPDFTGMGDFPDPREFRRRQTTCPKCLGLPEPTPEPEAVAPSQPGAKHGEYGERIVGRLAGGIRLPGRSGRAEQESVCQGAKGQNRRLDSVTTAGCEAA